MSLFKENSAVFSPCQKYRYSLTRHWLVPGDGMVLWIMLNPSTATAECDDPTIRRCVGFSLRLRAASLEVVNLFALRSTDPKRLYDEADPVGPENDAHIADAASRAKIIVCAWGEHGKLRKRATTVFDALSSKYKLHAIGLNASGMPKHPLYVPAENDPVQITSLTAKKKI